MPFSFGLQALEKAIEETITEKAWDLYLVLLPNWDSKDRLNFNDFLKKIKRTGNNISVSTISEDDMKRYADIADLQRHRVNKGE